MAKASKASGSTPAVRALQAADIAFGEHPYHHDPSAASYGLEAAEALGVPAAQVFKTLVADTGSELVVGVVPVAGQLDLKALAAALGVKKLAMAKVADAERSSGYVAGGISPIGQRKALRTVIDQSALDFDRVYVSGGRRGFDISLAPADLVQVTKAVTAPIATDS